MDFEIVYPKIKKQSLAMLRVRYVFGLIFLAAAVACPVVNIATGGPAWSVIVLWSLYMVWTLCLKLPLVDRNLINLGVRFAVMTVILLVRYLIAFRRMSSNKFLFAPSLHCPEPFVQL